MILPPMPGNVLSGYDLASFPLSTRTCAVLALIVAVAPIVLAATAFLGDDGLRALKPRRRRRHAPREKGVAAQSAAVRAMLRVVTIVEALGLVGPRSKTR